MGDPLISTVINSDSDSGPRLVADADHFLGTDRFLVQRRLGAGAFGVVYEAYDRQEKALVALKVLRVADGDALYRFKRDFRSLADIRHPNLVAFYELMTHESLWFFSMELIPGENYAETLRRGRRPGEAPDYDQVRRITRQLMKGLQTVHEHGKVHRDIKPPNVLVTPEGRVKLLDFGLVAELNPGGVPEAEQQMVGTPAYMSPEQADGQVGRPSSDWYSVGVMLYQALLGRLPFEGSLLQILTRKRQGVEPGVLRRSLPDLPDDLERLCTGLLATHVEHRLTGPEALALVEGQTVPSGVMRSFEPEVPFVGREGYLRRLDEALDAAREGAVMVTLRGPSGMGKSALVQQFLDRLSGRLPDAVILSGRCYMQESVPYKAIDSLIDDLSKYLMGLPAPAVEAILPEGMAELARLFPVLARVRAVAQAPVAEDADSVGPQVLRRRAFAALRKLLVRLAARFPVVLVMDDLQWGDVDSALLLDRMLTRADDLPLLLVACYRSDNESSSTFLRTLAEHKRDLIRRGVEVRDILLGELSDDESRRLLRQLGGIEDRQIGSVLSDAAGSPLFLSELARAAEKEAAGRPRAGDLGRDGESGVDRLIRARAERLSDPARRLLEIVAVAGRPVALEPAREAARLTSGGVSALAELRQRRMVRVLEGEHGEELETYHDRIREALTAGSSEARLRTLHGRLAEALESTGQADPETLAMHFQATEEVQRASRYAVSAAERAEEALAFDRAARLYRLAMDLGPQAAEQRADIQIRLGEALGHAGRSRDAAETLLRAVGSGVVDPVEAQRSAAEKLLISGHIDRGLAVLRHVLRTVDMELETRPWKSLMSLWWHRLCLRLRGFDFEPKTADEIDPDALRKIDICWSAEIGLCLVDVLRASEFHIRHLWLALKAGEPQRVARGLAMEVFFGAMEGADADAALERARELAGRVEGRYAASLTEMAAGMLACTKGQWQEAEKRLSRADMHLRENRRGVTWELDTVRQFRAVALLNLGRWRELFRDLPRLLEQAREQEDLFLETHLHHWVETIRHLVEDRPRQAAETALEGDWSQQGFHYQHFGHLMAQTQVSLYSGRGVEAWERLDSRWPDLTRSMIQRIDMVWVQTYNLRAGSALAAAVELRAQGAGGEATRAEKQARGDIQQLERIASRWSQALVWALKAGLASLSGAEGSAERALQAAREAFQAADMSIHAAAAARHLASLRDAATEIDQAEAIMTAAGIARPARFALMLVPGRWSKTG